MPLELLAEVVIADPPTGVWPHRDFPDEVQINGRTFRYAQWQKPYPGVVAQYREPVPRFSQHLKVRRDGTWIIDHVDEYNPDMGYATLHFFTDYQPGKAAWAVYSIFGISSVLFALYALASRKTKSA